MLTDGTVLVAILKC